MLPTPRLIVLRRVTPWSCSFLVTDTANRTTNSNKCKYSIRHVAIPIGLPADRTPTYSGRSVERRPGVTFAIGKRHPRRLSPLLTAIAHFPRPSTRPPVAVAYRRPFYEHCYSIAADHAGRVTYAARNRRNRYQVGLSRPAPGSTRPTRRGHPRPGSVWSPIPSARP